MVSASDEDEALVDRHLRAVAGDARFREALLWQNRASIDIVDRRLRDGLGSAAERRNAAELVAMYVQRYAVKNDSVGFFGPVGWASVENERHAVDVRPGPDLVEHG